MRPHVMGRAARRGSGADFPLHFLLYIMDTIMPAPTGLIQQLDQFLHKNALLAPRSRILVACSGGADSMALLHLLCCVNQSRFWKWKLIIGHVNHGLRGRESRADEALVRQTAKTLGLPLELRRLTWPRHPRTTGNRQPQISENAARTARLAALQAMARKRRCTVVAMAHHADDQAETVLLRLLRGAGTGGLSGIRPCRRLGTLHLVRPLLGWSRAALRHWLQSQNHSWREDKSNQNARFLRNRIRLELLPLLESYQPGIRKVLVNMAARQRSTHSFLMRHSRHLLRRCLLRKTSRAWDLDARRLLAASGDAAAMVLRSGIAALGGKKDRISGTILTELLDQLRQTPHPVRRQFSGPVNIESRRGIVRISRGGPPAPNRQKSVRSAASGQPKSDGKPGKKPRRAPTRRITRKATA